MDRAAIEAYYASMYVDIMKTYPAQVKVYDKLRENYTKEQLSEKLDKTYYEKTPINYLTIIEKAYRFKVFSGAMIELYVEADDMRVCLELLNICKDVLKEMEPRVPGSIINEVGVMYSPASGKAYDSKKNEKEEKGDNQESKVNSEITNRSLKNTILIAMMAATSLMLLSVVMSAILIPTINRESDFQPYFVECMGEYECGQLEILACIIEKEIKVSHLHSIGIISTTKLYGRSEAFYVNLQKQ